MKHFILLSIFSITLFTTGCIQTPEPDVPKRVAVVYNVDNVGNNIIVGQDTINVEVVKLLADKINFTFIDDRVLQTQPDALVMTYRDIFEGEDETIVAANIGIDNFQGFKSLQIFIEPPRKGIILLTMISSATRTISPLSSPGASIIKISPIAQGRFLKRISLSTQTLNFPTKMRPFYQELPMI